MLLLVYNKNSEISKKSLEYRLNKEFYPRFCVMCKTGTLKIRFDLFPEAKSIDF